MTWQAVTEATGPVSGRGSFLGPDTSRRTRWWRLVLACGHEAERAVRYGPPKDGRQRQRGGTQHRSADDVLPAPRRARCWRCQTPAGRELS